MSEPNFKAFLEAQPALQGLRVKVFPDRIPQAHAEPAIVFQKTGATRQQKLCGTDGLVRGDFQLDCYGTSRSIVRQIHEAVLTAMLDFAGVMGTCVVKHCALSTDFDSVDPDPGLLKRTQLWEVWYVER